MGTIMGLVKAIGYLYPLLKKIVLLLITIAILIYIIKITWYVG